jgi:crossover junction endodeoxyribonuclease RuvC
MGFGCDAEDPPRHFALRTSGRLCHGARVGISPKQFEQLQSRVTRSKRQGTAPAPAGPTPVSARVHEVILGVDPSLRGTGFGVIRAAKPQPLTLAQGTIHCPAGWERSRCLAKIHETLRDVIRQHQPTVCIVEGLFFAQNLQTAIIMGEARGAALAAMAEAGLEIYEVAPRKVKQAIVGYGAAQKIAVAKMVQRMLQLAELPEPDAADALALALTHVQSSGRFSLAAPKRV